MRIGQAPAGLPMEDVAVHVSHEILVEVDDNSALIVGDP